MTVQAYVGALNEGEGLLRPIKRGERAATPPAAQAFNAELSRRRVRIEHVFARLKTFRVLQGLFPYRGEQLGTVPGPPPWFTTPTAWRRLKKDEPLKLRGSEGGVGGWLNYGTAFSWNVLFDGRGAQVRLPALSCCPRCTQSPLAGEGMKGISFAWKPRFARPP